MADRSAPAPVLWRAPRPLLLASTSATREAVLVQAGLPVETEAPGVDERAVEAALPTGSGPELIARALAEAKAVAVSRRRPGRIVVGADQVLWCDGEAFGKAHSPDEAVRHLEKLSGRRHALHSAVAVAENGQVTASFVDAAHLDMRALARPEIERYVALAGPVATRSVGAYEIEGLGIHLFERIDGQHSTILGLPLLPLLDALRQIGAVAL